MRVNLAAEIRPGRPSSDFAWTAVLGDMGGQGSDRWESEDVGHGDLFGRGSKKMLT